MKTFVIFAALGFACFLIIACSEKQPATMGQAEKTETEASTQVAASDTAEVAEILGCSATTVRNHIFQARKNLRRELGSRFPEYLPSSDRG